MTNFRHSGESRNPEGQGNVDNAIPIG